MASVASAGMFRKMVATRARNAEAAQADAQRRATCPFEAARRLLQQRGYTVYAESVVKPRSKLIVVGRLKMSRKEVIAYAKRIQRAN